MLPKYLIYQAKKVDFVEVEVEVWLNNPKYLDKAIEEMKKEVKKKNEKGEEYIYEYYYFLTAYHLEGKDAQRNKIERLYLRQTNTIL